MTEEIERRKEVFAWFGGAAYHAQCFEVELRSLLLLAYRLNHRTATISNIETVDLRMSKKNLGELLKQLKSHFEIAPEFSELLNTYREKRNYLMHHFFFDNARNLFSATGCNAMVDELRELSQVFREADAISQVMSKHLRALAGWSEQEFDELVRAEMRKEH